MEGNPASIYRGINKQNKNEVAIKYYKKIYKEHYEKEKNLLLLMDHPNILSIQESFENQDGYFIIFPFFKQSLLEYILSPGDISERVMATIILQVLKALHYLHEGKTINHTHIVHRDIKPENILIDLMPEKPILNCLNQFCCNPIEHHLPPVKVVVCDFDLSESFQPGQQFHQMCGSIHYCAPEIWEEKYDEKCDIWSLGIVMYGMVEMKTPYSDSFIKKNRKASHSFPIQYDEKNWAKYHPSALDFQKKMVCTDPDKRWSLSQLLSHEWITKFSCQ